MMNDAADSAGPEDSSEDSSFIAHHSSFFDTHAHLDQEDFDADRDEVIAAARRAGVEMVLCVGVSVASSRAACQLARQYGLLAAVGIHPNSTANALPDNWSQIVALAGQLGVVALGETGLDRYRDFAPLERQEEYLDRHLRLSRQTGLPVIIHCRDAQAELLPLLRRAAADGPLRGVMHAFSGDADFAAQCLALGLYLSFAGNVTYSNKKFEPFARSRPPCRRTGCSSRPTVPIWCRKRSAAGSGGTSRPRSCKRPNALPGSAVRRSSSLPPPLRPTPDGCSDCRGPGGKADHYL